MRVRTLGRFAVLLAGVACRHEPTQMPAATPPQPAPAIAGAEAPAPPPGGPRYFGEATYYSDRLAGRPTASGERYDPSAMTAAHRTLPFGTLVKVVRQDDGRDVIVRINDRGPFARRERIIDLSRAAAERLNMISDGVVGVSVEVLEGR